MKLAHGVENMGKHLRQKELFVHLEDVAVEVNTLPGFILCDARHKLQEGVVKGNADCGGTL